MNKKLFLILVMMPVCLAIGQNKRITIKQNFLNTRSETEYIQRTLTYVLDFPRLSMEVNRVKEYNLVTFDETAASDTIKMPVTYEIDYDTDNPVADNELEELIIPDKMSLIKKNIKYEHTEKGYQLVNSKSKNLMKTIYSSVPQIHSDPVVNTIRFEPRKEKSWSDSTYSKEDNGGLYVNHFSLQEKCQNASICYEVKGQFIGNPVDLTSLSPSLERVRYTVHLKKEYSGFIICTPDGFITEIKLVTKSQGFHYTIHEGLNQIPFDFTYTSLITNEIR